MHSGTKPQIVIGSDHGGYELKEVISAWLIEQGYSVSDEGAHVFDPTDDYPQVAFSVAQKVADSQNAVGILLCRSSGGEVIAANKVTGIRAVSVFNSQSAVHAKEHNNANVIALPADWLTVEEVKKYILEFLETHFLQEERHVRRIAQISAYERDRQ